MFFIEFIGPFSLDSSIARILPARPGNTNKNTIRTYSTALKPIRLVLLLKYIALIYSPLRLVSNYTAIKINCYTVLNILPCHIE